MKRLAMLALLVASCGASAHTDYFHCTKQVEGKSVVYTGIAGTYDMAQGYGGWSVDGIETTVKPTDNRDYEVDQHGDKVVSDKTPFHEYADGTYDNNFTLIKKNGIKIHYSCRSFPDPNSAPVQVQQPVRAYPGHCEYPTDIAADGSICGGRAASVRPGGYN